MFKIAICDDEDYFRKGIREILTGYMEEKGVLYEIDEFESGKDFVNLGIGIIQYKIVFLDINMDELDGMETAQKIREISHGIFIAFVTAYINFALDGYQVDAIRYILKNNSNLAESKNIARIKEHSKNHSYVGGQHYLWECSIRSRNDFYKLYGNGCYFMCSIAVYSKNFQTGGEGE